MKISLNTLRGINKRHGSADDIAPNGIKALAEKIGAQLAAVENVTEAGKKYDGVVIAKIISCEPHPDADKLKVCTIDDGGNTPGVNRDPNDHIQVVCGAPNARAGLTVAWLPPGSTVPDSYGKEPFVLEARELRGVVSNGMLASPKELGIGDNHDGILEIEEDVKPGTLFADKYELAGDHILELENKMFTHRPDCFGFLGISRELAGIQQMPFKSPAWYTLSPEFPASETTELPLEVQNEIPELVPRFAAITMAEVDVKPSPVWLQVELSKIGLRPINNIVDYTNFFMLKTGQPLHAYDYDKVAAFSGSSAKLIIRQPRDGEKIKLLTGKEIEPHKSAIMIAAGEHAIGIGGVMGGSETEVDDNTKNIILECANFDMYNIRRTAMIHGLFTDAVTRFTKGQSPLQNLAILAKIVNEIKEFTGGKVASAVVDDNHLSQEVLDRGSLYPAVQVTAEFISRRLGLAISAEEIASLLTNVEFKVSIQSEMLEVNAPFWRTDIEIPEDVVEEVGRLYGYDRLPLELPSRDLTPARPDPLVSLKSEIRAALANAGANELLTYSFVHGNLLDKAGQDRAQAFELSNALSPDLQYYRQSLTPSLLDKIHANIKAGFDEFAIFEIGKVHIKSEKDQDGLPQEFERVALAYAASDRTSGSTTGAAYYQAQKFATYLLDELGISEFKLDTYNLDLSDNLLAASRAAPFEPSRRSAILAAVNGQQNVMIGIIGEFTAEAAKKLKLPSFSAGFELETSLLNELKKENTKSRYTPLSRFPSVSQDISLKVPADLPFADLFTFIQQNLNPPENTHHTLEPIDIYQRADDKTHKQTTLRLQIASYEKTMTDAEVNKLLEDAAAKAHAQFGAERL